MNNFDTVSTDVLIIGGGPSGLATAIHLAGLSGENGQKYRILLIEKGSTEVITAPVINEEIGGGRVQISGMANTQEATDIALLLRAGALAAPMDIIEERTVDAHVGRLRDTLEEAGYHACIETVRGVGYRYTEALATNPDGARGAATEYRRRVTDELRRRATDQT